MSFLSELTGWQHAFLWLWLYRYLRLIVNIVSHWVYKTVPIPAKPSFTPKDVTVIIPTIHNNFEELRDSLQSILACHPSELLLVTTTDKYQKLLSFVKTLEASNIRVFHVPIANKRIQVCEAIPKVKTGIIIMADDDVTWPRTILPWLLAPFENPKMGGVGPCQRVQRLKTGTGSEKGYNWLGAAYIERRNFEISATHGIDGGTSCMSGRTCAFRSEILQSPLFLDGFKTERWMNYSLNADDDNFVTRWLVSNGWATWIQYNRECEIETTLENNTKFLYQCTRWSRSNWRSNWTSLVLERHVWRQQQWCVYALHMATFTMLSIVWDPMLLGLCYLASAPFGATIQRYAMIAQGLFMLFSKVVKLLGLFIRNPTDIMYLPLSIFFGYAHAFIKIYALITINTTSWGSREDGDANDSHRMSPRARRSESITSPPPNHPGLIRYNDSKAPLPHPQLSYSITHDSEPESDYKRSESSSVYELDSDSDIDDSEPDLTDNGYENEKSTNRELMVHS